MILSEFLKKNGMKHKFFAEKICVAEATLASWLTNKSYPSFINIVLVERFTKGNVGLKDWIKQRSNYVDMQFKMTQNIASRKKKLHQYH